MNSSFNRDRFFLEKFMRILNREMIPLEIIDTNGKKYTTGQDVIKYRIHINDRKFFRALISLDAFSLGEAYVKGYFDISGSIRDLYEQVCEKLLSLNQKKASIRFVSKIFNRTSQRKIEKENVEYHYDIPSAFYRIFLGRTMGYTCGYYTREEAGMDDAQIEKMDIICRKLRLKPGEKLLDIGCGWGNFAIYAAKHYGVQVTGITLSSEQKKYADQWVEKEGLQQEIEIKILNYRDLGEDQFDKISCVGMSEHVGRNNMAHFFNVVHNSLKKGGLFMQHTITTNVLRKKGYENAFLNQYMFPGGELMFEDDLIHLASSAGFELLNAENFRPHYVRTLNDWIIRMEKQKDKLLEVVGDNVYRIYHVFFIGSLIAFRSKNISLFQNLFYKTNPDDTSTDVFLSPYSKNETRLA